MTATDHALELTRVAAAAAADKLGTDLIAYDVSDQLAITDVFLVVTAANERQVGAVVDGIEEALRGHDVKPVRREGDRVQRYVHIGTGNYNPSTARLYTDLGIFTCREDLVEDVADLFNHLTGFARPPSYRRALVAPAHLRDGIVAEIDRAIAGHSAESPSRVVMKMNAIIDGPMIAAVYR
ncbi:RsfS/YbeB/iojap family protein, partial [Bradyrhizobium sp. NBAIM08]|nr:RsfS/YbeB/iojap family protein [Bradyrhizobium sp. NBAIM08]